MHIFGLIIVFLKEDHAGGDRILPTVSRLSALYLAAPSSPDLAGAVVPDVFEPAVRLDDSAQQSRVVGLVLNLGRDHNCSGGSGASGDS